MSSAHSAVSDSTPVLEEVPPPQKIFCAFGRSGCLYFQVGTAIEADNYEQALKAFSAYPNTEVVQKGSRKYNHIVRALQK